MTKAEYNKKYYKKNKEKIQKLQAQWRDNNQEYVRKTSAEWYKKNKKHVQAYVKTNKEKIRKGVLKRLRNPPATFLFAWAKQRAKKFSLPFNLEIKDIKVPEVCPVLGIRLKHGKRGNPTSPSLDRIKPKLGYTKGNVAVISRRANFLKNDATLQELESLVKYLKEKP